MKFVCKLLNKPVPNLLALKLVGFCTLHCAPWQKHVSLFIGRGKQIAPFWGIAFGFVPLNESAQPLIITAKKLSVYFQIKLYGRIQLSFSIWTKHPFWQVSMLIVGTSLITSGSGSTVPLHKSPKSGSVEEHTMHCDVAKNFIHNGSNL